MVWKMDVNGKQKYTNTDATQIDTAANSPIIIGNRSTNAGTELYQ
jgi:hypothetical protein